MLIGDLARRAGTTAKTLRFYEHEGLLPEPARTPSGYRAYLPDTVERVVFIRDAQGAGFTLRRIGQILGIQRIAELEQARAHLYELARRTRELDPADCGGYCEIIHYA